MRPSRGRGAFQRVLPKQASPGKLFAKLHCALRVSLSLALIVAYVFRDTEVTPLAKATPLEAAAAVGLGKLYMLLLTTLAKGRALKYTAPMLCVFVLIQAFVMGFGAAMDKTRTAMWVGACLNLLLAISMANRRFTFVAVDVRNGYRLAAPVVAMLVVAEYIIFMLGLPRVSFVVGATLLLGGFIFWAIDSHEARYNTETPAQAIAPLMAEIALAMYVPTLLIKAYMAASA